MNNSKFSPIYNRIIHALFRLLRRKNVSIRLGIGFILITVLPILAVGYFSYERGSHAIYTKMSRSITQTMEQVGVNLSHQLQAIINDGTEIAYSELVQSALVNYNDLSGQEIHDIETKLSDYINKKYIFSSSVAEITLYTTEMGRINAYGPSDFRFMPKKENLDWLIERAKELDGICLWVAVGPDFEEGLASKVFKVRNNIILARAVKSLKNGNQIGYILMRIDEQQFLNLYGSIDIGAGTQMFILNSENKVISSAGDYAEFSKSYPRPELLRQINSSTEKSFSFKTDDGSYLAAFSSIRQADWYVVALIQFSYLYSESHNLLWDVFLIGLICLLFALCISYIIYQSILNPTRQLIYGIDSFKNGRLDILIDDSGNDEFSELNQRFNEMAINTKQLINDIKEKEIQKRELEIRALQAQINPHFLANTLNTVSYLASLKKENHIVRLIESILMLLNGCMKNDSSMTTVEDEISFLKSYIYIQEMRLYGSFTVQYNIDPSINHYLIPRFLLQPVVENALIHGIEPSDKTGLIVIRGSIQESKLHFSITDNGVGMNQEQINSLLSSDDCKDKGRLSGIGIPNVRNRIQLLYGSDYGLYINSIEGVFTTVDIYLPVITDNEEDD
ncbi:MAG: sensor histidine kinase [Clostridiaceae bacterium]|nr:sensor histidine kinase [Clostridiaceae bacterium]